MLQQLVLQFRGDSLPKYLELATLDSQIAALLTGTESFDGIDTIEGNVNIFIYTEDPDRTFQRVRVLFENAEQELGFTAAYRLVADNAFRVLWPEDAAVFRLRAEPKSPA